MDWTKAKTILILALIATNLFLIFTYGFKEKDISENTNEEALLYILSERGISLDAEIPKKHADMPILHGEYLTYSEEDKEALLQTRKKLPRPVTEEAYIEAAEDFISYLGMMNENLVYDRTETNGGSTEVFFRNEVNGVKLEGSVMTCLFEDDVLTDFEGVWLMPAEFSQKKAETISAAVALMSLTNPTENETLVIEKIEMVYWIPETDIEVQHPVSDTAFPTWKISAAGSRDFFVEAIQR